MMFGGSTTSLLSVLNDINYAEYTVDLLFYDKLGELYNYLPKEVNVIEPVCRYPDIRKLRIRKLFSLKSIVSIIRGRMLGKRFWVKCQFGALDNVRYCRRYDTHYDIAISYLELWPLYYLADCVNADRKIAWIHTDYSVLNLVEKYENKAFEKMDSIVLISDKCKERFLRCFPNWEYKTKVVENFLSEKFVRERARDAVDFSVKQDCLNFVTVCRIDFLSKGLDRAVSIIKQLKREGYTQYFHWYIIGSGADEKKLQALLDEKNVRDCITLLGAKKNPYPFEIQCDVFFLPSRYEGKPIAVTEAQILGLVPIVTNYSSAMEQVLDMVDGIILRNDEKGIYEGIKKILCNRKLLDTLKKNVSSKKIPSDGCKQWNELLTKTISGIAEEDIFKNDTHGASVNRNHYSKGSDAS